MSKLSTHFSYYLTLPGKYTSKPQICQGIVAIKDASPFCRKSYFIYVRILNGDNGHVILYTGKEQWHNPLKHHQPRKMLHK